MNDRREDDAFDAGAIEAVDILIVGAGLSGIGAAHHLQRRCPGRRYLILESRAAMGGTWDLFRYPGIRSDSDMFTLGYSFRPWQQAKSIADGASIARYIRETADEAGITRHIRFGHTVKRAAWVGADACWTVVVETAGGVTVRMRAQFLYFCSGYFDYATGHRPRFEGESDFRGTLVHPQFWPEGLEYADKRVVVIGSGATAVTLVPELARRASRVSMLQRSPSYVINLPSVDRIARAFERWLPRRLAYGLVRWKSVLVGRFYYRLARRRPAVVKQRMVSMVGRALGPKFDVATHFTPRYDPWDQRVCIVPDGDLFRQIRAGRVEMVTDRIDRFTPSGILLASGRELPADIVVMATGLKLKMLGGVELSVDGVPVDFSRLVSYKGMMFGNLPNLAMAFGYTNASWTLKVDLTAAFVCRLLRYMDRHRFAIAFPKRDPADATQSFVGFTSGYVQRAQAELPRQGTRAPWLVHHDYLADLYDIRWGRVADGVMHFERRRQAT